MKLAPSHTVGMWLFGILFDNNEHGAVYNRKRNNTVNF